MTTTTSVRDVLLEIVNELQDLRANQLMLSEQGVANQSAPQSTPARDIRTRQFRDIYDKLRRQVEQLAF